MDLQKEYDEKEEEINSRIEEFRKLRDADEERIFKELVFVILTSQSKAKKCWEATNKLEQLDLLKSGTEDEIAEVLREYDISYEIDKAGYIVENRKKLSQPTLKNPSGNLKIKDRIDPERHDKTRGQFVDELQGVGWKAASHFLRNIGYGDDFAIVSGYIAKKLHKLGKN